MSYVLLCRFPDGVVLQAYFHPKELLSCVFDWLDNCLLDAKDDVITACSDVSAAASTTQKNAADDKRYDIILPRHLLMSKGPGCADGKDKPDRDCTLSDLGLVPGALLHCKWTASIPGALAGDPTSFETSSSATVDVESRDDGSVVSATATTRTVGMYLTELVRRDAFLGSAQASSNNSSGSASIVHALPSGQYLVPQPPSPQPSTVPQSTTSTSTSTTTKKIPKWFKR